MSPRKTKAAVPPGTAAMTEAEDSGDLIRRWTEEAAALSYEEALQALDLLLAELQGDAVPLADLQRTILHGEVYLDRCSTLLESVEQAVVQLNPETLAPETDA